MPYTDLEGTQHHLFPLSPSPSMARRKTYSHLDRAGPRGARHSRDFGARTYKMASTWSVVDGKEFCFDRLTETFAKNTLTTHETDSVQFITVYNRAR